MRNWPSKIHFRTSALPALLAISLLLFSAHAQNTGGGRTRFGRSYGLNNPISAAEQDEMQKALKPGFEEDTFTFARLRYGGGGGGFGRRFGRGGRTWDHDSPEADLSLTYRLFQVTSFKIHPGLNFVDITTKDLEKYPFVYLAGSGRLELTDSEVADLRRYLLNGGFMMAEDFWGDDDWDLFYAQMKRVFPEREPVELTVDHPIFQSVYHFKKEPQIPSTGTFFQTGKSYDYAPYFVKNNEPHFYAINDDKNRMMVLVCHNNHFGDGWEHESEDETYFETFSEPMGYPMFINLLEYTMTH